MAKALPPLWYTQLFENDGSVNAGGKIYTYAGGTTTPLATYTDASGSGTNDNPIILDSAGRADIFLTEDTAYKFVITDADDNILETTDGIIAYGDGSAAAQEYLLAMSYSGSPGAQAYMAGHIFDRDVTFPADLDGSRGSVGTNPASSYAVDIRKNGTTAATATIDTDGVYTFTTVSGASFSVTSGDVVDFIAPDSGSAADFAILLVGDVG